MMQDDFEFYDANQDEIVDGHINEFVIIKNAGVAGYYANEMDAFAVMKNEVPGTFMVKKCKPKGQDMLVYRTNRVAF
ncbi:hypothetical protein ACYULU_13180 [Breznakiellaceae bacterium SP9]